MPPNNEEVIQQSQNYLSENDEEQMLDLNLSENDEEQMYEHHRILVDKGQSMLRVDKFLATRLEKVSRSKIQNALIANSVLVNGKPVKANYKIKPFDDISVVLPHPPDNYTLHPENIPLNIIYEDNDLIVINKQAGLVVHPGLGNFSGTLVHGLLYYFQNLPIAPQHSNNTNTEIHYETRLRPGLVHRIDKNTSGLLVVAKTDFAMTHLAKQFFDHSVQRRYIALAWGDLPDAQGTIIGNMGRSAKNRKLREVFPDGTQGKHAVTHYKVLQRFGYVTLVECRLETGRTHQIRVHFKYIGHPLFNDNEYGGDRIVKGTIYDKYKQFVENCFKLLPRQALHAQSIGFIHPTTQKYMHFESNLPDDFEQVIDKWKSYKKNVIKMVLD